MAQAIKRLANEHRSITKVDNRVCDYYAAPLEDNIYEWHFTIRGPSVDSTNRELPYKDGIYHGKLTFPLNYPFEPPDIYFFTPNGRFKLHTKLCSTISSFHKELWRPTYDVDLILTSLRLFMGQESEIGIGSIAKTACSDADKRAMARDSWSHECAVCGCSVKDVWRMHMEPYPPTSAEKVTAVPQLPPGAAASTLRGEDGEEAAAHTSAEEGGVPQAADAAEPLAETATTTPAAAPTEAAGEGAASLPSPRPIAAAAATGATEAVLHPTSPTPAAATRAHLCGVHAAHPSVTQEAPDTPMREDRRASDAVLSSRWGADDTLPAPSPAADLQRSSTTTTTPRASSDTGGRGEAEHRVGAAAGVVAGGVAATPTVSPTGVEERGVATVPAAAEPTVAPSTPIPPRPTEQPRVVQASHEEGLPQPQPREEHHAHEQAREGHPPPPVQPTPPAGEVEEEKYVHVAVFGAALEVREAVLSRVVVMCMAGIGLILARRLVFHWLGVYL